MIIGIAVLVLCGLILIAIVGTAASLAIARQWRMLKRKSKAIRMGAPKVMIWPNSYQPLDKEKAVHAPLPFYPETVCPHCGFYDTHTMAAPRPMIDNTNAATVRRCKDCGHIWGEK